MENHNKIAGKCILITGANRGIGRALVEEALKRGAKRVYAGTRVPFTHPDQRVTHMIIDITSKEQIREAVQKVGVLDMLINNAGISLFDDLSDRTKIEGQLAVNLFGPYDMIQAFLPLLVRSQGAIVNNLSLLALAPLPLVAAYSISKAAAFSLTQSLRAYLAASGVKVHAVLTGPIDTDMNRGLNIPVPMASVESAAQCIFDGVENMEEDIFPDPLSKSIKEGWRSGVVKAFEKENARYVE
jgi:NAD(P)-dependent dehydrogenase (short-subunit alcohol dehydrogenase family)